MLKSQANSSNFNQAFWLGISHFSTFALAIVSAAILSRYFDKSEYGTYKQVMYVYTTLQTVFTVGLPRVFSYFIPRLNKGQSKFLVNRITGLLALLGGIFSIILYFGAGLFASILNNPELETGIKIFAIVPFFTLPAMGVEGIYTAIRETRYIAIYTTINRLLTLICVITPVLFLNGTYKSALIGWVIAHFFIFLFALYLKNKPFSSVDFEPIKQMYQTVFSYCIPLMAAGFAGLLLHSANQFFISRYYGDVTFAEFSNGYITIPFIGMIAGSVKSVLLPIFSKADSEGKTTDILATFNNAVKQIVIIIYPILLFCLFFSKDIIVFIYGEQYAVSKSYFQASLFKDFFDILPYFAVLLAIGKSNVYFLIHLFYVILIWFIDFILIKIQLPPIAIAYTYTFTYIFMIISFIIYISHTKKIFLLNKDILKYISKIIIHASLILIAIQAFSSYYLISWTVVWRLSVCGLLFFVITTLTGKLFKLNYLHSVYKLLGKS